MFCTNVHENQPLQWDSHELASWLSSRGLPPDVTEPFKQQSVFGLHAANLHDDDLVQLGIRHPIRRRRVIRELQQLFHGHSFASASVSDVVDESAELLDARSSPLWDATTARAERIPWRHKSSLEAHGWSSAGPVFTGQDIIAVEVDPEASWEEVEDQSTDTADPYDVMRQLSASKASLSRKCIKLRQELIEERRRRSIMISDQERRVCEAVRDKNGIKYSLRNAVRRSRSKERENEQLQARLKARDRECLDANANWEPAELYPLPSPRRNNRDAQEVVCSEERSPKQKVGAMSSRTRQSSRQPSARTSQSRSP
eukprot:TRINITY_DN7400_c0_g1_i2.p1 TRINITY_DN7400_c0_g1~~TRINITY_DN7400_c0_g1_i2.p1  ORF type:complete len:314 (-),score=35.48 TRINITY_DN7400_c0_g1_i2:40-981(-)